MTNHAHAREEFEKLANSAICWDASSRFDKESNEYEDEVLQPMWIIWQRSHEIAIKATAQRCVEIAGSVDSAMKCQKKIAKEFNL